MRLPRDRQEWSDRHLAAAVRERDQAFDRYEARVDFDRRENTDHLFSAYLRAEATAADVAVAVGGVR